MLPPKDSDPVPIPADSVLWEHECPKCGVEMEPIEIGVAGLPLKELELCPACYLVVWRDQGGFQVRQGVPMKKNVSPTDGRPWLNGGPKES